MSKMSNTIKGRITEIHEVETGTSKAGKSWAKQSFVIDTGSQYNPLVCISGFGDDKCDLIQKHRVGQEVEAFVNISSREYNGKWFHNIDLWKIEVQGGQQAQQQSTPTQSANDEDDDLPF